MRRQAIHEQVHRTGTLVSLRRLVIFRIHKLHLACGETVSIRSSVFDCCPLAICSSLSTLCRRHHQCDRAASSPLGIFILSHSNETKLSALAALAHLSWFWFCFCFCLLHSLPVWGVCCSCRESTSNPHPYVVAVARIALPLSRLARHSALSDPSALWVANIFCGFIVWTAPGRASWLAGWLVSLVRQPGEAAIGFRHSLHGMYCTVGQGWNQFKYLSTWKVNLRTQRVILIIIILKRTYIYLHMFKYTIYIIISLIPHINYNYYISSLQFF